MDDIRLKATPADAFYIKRAVLSRDGRAGLMTCAGDQSACFTCILVAKQAAGCQGFMVQVRPSVLLTYFHNGIGPVDPVARTCLLRMIPTMAAYRSPLRHLTGRFGHPGGLRGRIRICEPFESIDDAGLAPQVVAGCLKHSAKEC